MMLVHRFRFLPLLAALLPLLLALKPAQAETAIYYSAPENSFGWCAGYSHDRAHSCARKYCEEYGGTDCRLAIDCNGGWGAIAWAQNPLRGVGMTCGMSGAGPARFMALVSCMEVTKGVCWTADAFQSNGRNLSKENNQDFDLIWFAQAILSIRNYDPGTADGQMGPKTRAAIEKFQQDIGREATGTVDAELFLRMLDALGGGQYLAKKLVEDVLDEKREDLHDHIYSFSPSPAATATFSEELMTRSVDDRRLALATLLSAGGTKCSLPALDAYPLPDASSEIWSIECAEGSYTLMLSEGSRVVINNGPSSSSSTDETPAKTDADSGSSDSSAATAKGGARHSQTKPLQP